MNFHFAPHDPRRQQYQEEKVEEFRPDVLVRDPQRGIFYEAVLASFLEEKKWYVVKDVSSPDGEVCHLIYGPFTVKGMAVRFERTLPVSPLLDGAHSLRYSQQQLVIQGEVLGKKGAEYEVVEFVVPDASEGR